MRLRVGHVSTFPVLEPTQGIQPLSICVFLLGRRQMFIHLSIHLLIPQVFMEPSCVSDPMLLTGCREGNKRDTVSPVSPLKIALLSKLTGI